MKLLQGDQTCRGECIQEQPARAGSQQSTSCSGEHRVTRAAETETGTGRATTKGVCRRKPWDRCSSRTGSRLGQDRQQAGMGSTSSPGHSPALLFPHLHDCGQNVCLTEHSNPIHTKKGISVSQDVTKTKENPPGAGEQAILEPGVH